MTNDEDLSKLRDEVLPKLAELSNLCFRNSTAQDKLSGQLTNLETDTRRRITDVLSQMKNMKGGEDSSDRLGELVVSIEADLKRRLADQSGQLN